MADEAAVAPGKDAPAEGKKGLSALLAPIAAVVVLLGLGVGIGMFTSNLLSSVQKPVDAKATAKKDNGLTLESLHEVQLPDLISNVRNTQGRRYIKVSCSIWLTKLDATKMGFQAGGEGGKGGANDVKRVMQMSMEEHLKSYDLDELTGPNIYIELKKGFQDQIEKALHEIFPDFATDHRFVQRVVLTNLLVQ